MVGEYHRRRLALAISSLSLLVNATALVLLQYLPSDPFHLSAHFSAYAGFATVISLLGLIGTIRHSASLVLIFANHLLLDALLSTIPRLLILSLFFYMPSTACRSLAGMGGAGGNIMATGTSADAILPHPVDPVRIDVPVYREESDIDFDAVWMWLEQETASDARKCRLVMWILQGLLGMIVVGGTMVQWWCALRVREYGKRLGWKEAESKETGPRSRSSGAQDVEKARIS